MRLMQIVKEYKPYGLGSIFEMVGVDYQGKPVLRTGGVSHPHFFTIPKDFLQEIPLLDESPREARK